MVAGGRLCGDLRALIGASFSLSSLRMFAAVGPFDQAKASSSEDGGGVLVGFGPGLFFVWIGTPRLRLRFVVGSWLWSEFEHGLGFGYGPYYRLDYGLVFRLSSSTLLQLVLEVLGANYF